MSNIFRFLKLLRTRNACQANPKVRLCIVISWIHCRASNIFRLLKLLRTKNAFQANPERERLVEVCNTDAAADGTLFYIKNVKKKIGQISLQLWKKEFNCKP